MTSHSRQAKANHFEKELLFTDTCSLASHPSNTEDIKYLHFCITKICGDFSNKALGNTEKFSSNFCYLFIEYTTFFTMF